MSPYPYINPAVPLPAVIVRDYVTLEVRDARGVQRTHRARRPAGGAA